MKKLQKIGLMVAMAGCLFMASCAGSYYVTERPAEPVYVRPAAPYVGAVWIDGEWVWNGGRYVYSGGHWAAIRPGHVWVRGAWYQTPHGYAWHRGYWRHV
ncbi:hypothetical protein [Mucilaginibacter sp.]